MARFWIRFGLVSTAATVALASTPLQAGGTTLASEVKPKPKPRVVISLTVTGEQPLTAGDAVTVAARARPMPRGYRVLIDGKEQGASTWEAVEECAKAVCSSLWTEPDETTVVFRARVIHRRLVTKGPITTVVATSRLVPATWAPAPPPPPPPPPPPTAMAGRYCGFNDQGRTVCLDVTPDGLGVTNFSTQSLVTCSDSSQWYWLLSFRSVVKLDNLSFTYAYSGPLVGSNTTLTNIQTTYSINGTLDTQGNARGTLALTSISWDQNGTHHDCSSAPYAWSARLGA